MLAPRTPLCFAVCFQCRAGGGDSSCSQPQAEDTFSKKVSQKWGRAPLPTESRESPHIGRLPPARLSGPCAPASLQVAHLPFQKFLCKCYKLCIC